MNEWNSYLASYIVTTLNYIRPLKSHSFTVCHTVSLPFSRSHGWRWLLHFSRFYKFWVDFSQTHSFLRNQTKAAHSNCPMLLKNTFLVWLIKTKQAVAVVCFWIGHLTIVPLCHQRHMVTHFHGNHHPNCWKKWKNPRLNIIGNNLVSKYWGIKVVVFHTIHGDFSAEVSKQELSCNNMQTTENIQIKV